MCRRRKIAGMPPMDEKKPIDFAEHRREKTGICDCLNCTMVRASQGDEAAKRKIEGTFRKLEEATMKRLAEAKKARGKRTLEAGLLFGGGLILIATASPLAAAGAFLLYLSHCWDNHWGGING